MDGIIASADIGATKVAITLSGREGIFIKVQQPIKMEGGSGTVPDQVIHMIGEGLEQTGLTMEDITSLGISSAGPFKKEEGMIELICHNLCGGLDRNRKVVPNDWTSIPLEKVLRGQFEKIVILNDAVSGAVAEKTFGAGMGHDDLIYVTWSTGIGTGAYVDGRLIKGKNGNAPHGGHVYVGDEGPVCGCGNICDLESVASGSAIALQYGDGRKTEEVFRSYGMDQKAKKVIDAAARAMGKGLASINCILDTGLITIGGSVFINNVDLLLPLVRSEFYRSFPVLSSGVDIVPTGLGASLGDVAAISLTIPEDWIDQWRSTKPWERGPRTIHLD